MADHGAMRVEKLSDDQEVGAESENVSDHDIVTSGTSKPVVAAKVKTEEAAGTAKSAAVAGATATGGKMAGAVVVLTTTAAIDAGSAAALGAAPVAEGTAKAVGVPRPTVA